MKNGVAELIETHEGRRPRPYRDTRGLLTIGVGRCLDRNPLSGDEIDFLRDNDIRAATGAASSLVGPSFYVASEPRRAVLIDMAFHLGREGLAGFRRLLAAVRAEDWDTAARELLDSDMAKQTPDRAQMNAEILRSGHWPDEVPGV